MLYSLFSQKDRPRWSVLTPHTLWKGDLIMMSFRGVTVYTDFPQEQPVAHETVAWAKIHVSDGTREVKLHVNAEFDVDTIPFTVFGGKAERLEEKGFELHVPVRWENGLPHTRQPGVDNVDVHLLGYDGKDLDVQCAVVTRGGEFYITSQLVFEGHVVRTVGDRVGSVRYVMIPTTNPRFAYQDFNYENTWGPMDAAVKAVAEEEGVPRPRWRIVRLAEVRAAVWAPRMIPVKPGWERGTVLYHNAVTGTGLIEGLDGERYFLHYKAVQTKGNMRMVEPMDSIYFRPGPNEGKASRPVALLLPFTPAPAAA
jgi:cold shock CspA family protein